MDMRRTVHILAALLLTSPVSAADASNDAHDGDALFDALLAVCGQSFEGQLEEGTEPSDGKRIATKALARKYIQRVELELHREALLSVL